MIPSSAEDDSAGAALTSGVLAFEHFLRTHPRTVVVLTALSIAVIGVVHIHSTDELALGVTYSLPLVLCAYGAGIVAGMVAAIAVSGLWLYDALNREL